jgi:hypothetical protein
MPPLEADALSAPEWGSVRAFVREGRDAARWLHEYGHKRMNLPRDLVMPWFRTGGERLRRVPAVVSQLEVHA